MILRAHPLKAVKKDLELHRRSAELALEQLTEAQVAQYLAARLGPTVTDDADTDRLARALPQRTDGNALFLVTVVDALVRRGVIAEGREMKIAAATASATSGGSRRRTGSSRLGQRCPGRRLSPCRICRPRER